MSESKKDKSLHLEEIKYLSMRQMMEMKRETLEQLLYQADRDLFQAQLTRNWLDTTVQFCLWNENQKEQKELEVSNV